MAKLPHRRRAAGGRRSFRRSFVEVLEPRILLSADLPGLDPDLLLPPVEEVVGRRSEPVESHVAEALRDARRELVFVDAAVAGHEDLVSDLRERHGGRDLRVHRLDPGRDGVNEIGRVLADLAALGQRLDAVHVLSHGSERGLALGSTFLTAEGLAERAADVASWRGALAPGADLLLYGCSLAAGDEGLSLVEGLSVLTGADVAASTDATGHAGRGGDWHLESHTGTIETEIAIGGATRSAWQGLLPAEELTLHLATRNDVSAGGQPGEDTFSEGDLIAIGDPDLDLGPGTTSGTFSIGIDVDAFAPGIDLGAAHLVSEDIAIGSSGFQLLAGDLLLTSKSSSTTFISNNTGPRDPGFEASVAATRNDLVVYRPDAPGDYSTGAFALLLEDVSGDNASLRSITLVEQTTTVGGTLLEAGDFLYARSGGSVDHNIYLYETGTTGVGATPEGRSLLLAGDDALVGIEKQIRGLELLESAATIGGETLDAGTLLVAVDNAETVGSNGLAVDQFDVFALDVAQSSLAAGPGNGEASATLLFDGSQVGFDSTDEELDAVMLASTTGAPPNTAPSGADGIVTTAEDTPYVFTAADFGFSDPGEGDAFADVMVTTAPGVGTLRDGASVLVGGEVVTAASIAAGNLVYTPPADANGAALASFGFQVRDDGGTAGGGEDTDPTPNTLTVDVTALNNAPAGADRTVVTAEDTPYVFTAADFGFSDPADGDAFAGVVVTSAPGAGTLRDGASVLVGGEVVTAASIAAGNLVYTPPADANGAGVASFGFQVRDDGGTAGGGVDTDPTPNTLTVDVTALNDAPVLAPATPVLSPITEDALSNAGEQIATLVAATIDDVDALALEGIALTHVEASGGSWQYSIDGGATWSDVGAVDAGSALLLRETDRIRFRPDGNNGETASFDFRAWDRTSGAVATKADTGPGGPTSSFSSGSNRATISVAGTNDAPTIAGAALGDVATSDPDPAGASLAALYAGGFSDVDAGATLAGVAVVGNAASAATEGSWQYSSDGGANWSDIGSVTDGPAALVLSESTRLRFLPAPGFEGSPASLVVRALDDSFGGSFSSNAGGTQLRQTVDTGTNGGSSSISAATAQLSANVLAPDEGGFSLATEGVADALDSLEETSADGEGDPLRAETGAGAGERDPDAEATGDSPAALSATLQRPSRVELPAEATDGFGLAVARRSPAGPAAPTPEREAGDPARRGSHTGPEVRLAEAPTLLGRLLGDGLGLLGPAGELLDDLDRLRDEVAAETRLADTLAATSMALTAGLSVGYAIWLTRGGLLIASFASSMPFWRLVDPVPVLASLGAAADEEDAESLDSLIREGEARGRDTRRDSSEGQGA